MAKNLNTFVVNSNNNMMIIFLGKKKIKEKIARNAMTK